MIFDAAFYRTKVTPLSLKFPTFPCTYQINYFLFHHFQDIQCRIPDLIIYYNMLNFPTVYKSDWFPIVITPIPLEHYFTHIVSPVDGIFYTVPSLHLHYSPSTDSSALPSNCRLLVNNPPRTAGGKSWLGEGKGSS